MYYQIQVDGDDVENLLSLLEYAKQQYQYTEAEYATDGDAVIRMIDVYAARIIEGAEKQGGEFTDEGLIFTESNEPS